MAIGHLSVRVGKVGKAQPHAAYIARQGHYSNRLTVERLEYTTVGNMPAWAQHDPLQFWQAADAHERSNGSTYREFEIALPRELSPPQRQALILEFVQQELGTHHPYQLAIHTPKAVDGQDQPHCHLMFCERKLDGIERDPEQFFKRYNAKNPERGGAKKGYGEQAGQTLKPIERQAELKALRQRWETLCNTHLKQAGIESRIDMRSYQERKLDREPEPKQHPQRWKDPKQRAVLLEFRAAQQEQAQAQQMVKAEIKNPTAERILLDDRKRQQLQLAPERIEQVFFELLVEASQALERAKELAEQKYKAAEQQWLASEQNKPTKGFFMTEKGFIKRQARWEIENNTVYEHYKEALTACRQLENTSPEVLAQQKLDAHYPALAAEKRRLEKLALEREEQARKLEKEKRDQAQQQAIKENREKRDQERIQRQRRRNNDKGFSR